MQFFTFLKIMFQKIIVSWFCFKNVFSYYVSNMSNTLQTNLDSKVLLKYNYLSKCVSELFASYVKKKKIAIFELKLCYNDQRKLDNLNIGYPVNLMFTIWCLQFWRPRFGVGQFGDWDNFSFCKSAHLIV